MSNSPIRWVGTIVDRGKGRGVALLFKKYGHQVLLIVRGHGTASSAIMDCLGLDEPEKDLVLGIGPAAYSRRLLRGLQSEMELSRSGHGIAFTVPLSGISAAAAQQLKGPGNDAATGPPCSQKEDIAMSDDVKYELVAAIINSDVINPVMEAARKAGCKGGTLIKARELESGEDKKIFGLTLAQEKDILLILTPSSAKQLILRAVCETVLKETGEHALVISLPVEQTEGVHI